MADFSGTEVMALPRSNLTAPEHAGCSVPCEELYVLPGADELSILLRGRRSR